MLVVCLGTLARNPKETELTKESQFESVLDAAVLKTDREVLIEVLESNGYGPWEIRLAVERLDKDPILKKSQLTLSNENEHSTGIDQHPVTSAIQ